MGSNHPPARSATDPPASGDMREEALARLDYYYYAYNYNPHDHYHYHYNLNH